MVLENYVVDGQYSHSEAQYTEGEHKVENHSSSMLDVNEKVTSFNHFSNLETEK